MSVERLDVETCEHRYAVKFHRNIYGFLLGRLTPGQIRLRFDESKIGALLKIAWWDWSDAKIDAAMPFLLSGDISALNCFASSYS